MDLKEFGKLLEKCADKHPGLDVGEVTIRAIKFTRGGGHIWFSLSYDEDHSDNLTVQTLTHEYVGDVSLDDEEVMD